MDRRWKVGTRTAAILVSALVLECCQAPSDEVFISNITNQDLPVILQGKDGKGAETMIAAGRLMDVPCAKAALLSINNNGRVDKWQLTCGQRYALQVTLDRTAFEVTEVRSK